MKYVVYLLLCSDGTLYCGQTNNLKRRVKEHNTGNGKGAKYTRSRRPVTLAYSEKHKTHKDAMQRERLIKSWPRKRKMKLANLIHL